jgi:hypothetical protein
MSALPGGVNRTTGGSFTMKRLSLRFLLAGLLLALACPEAFAQAGSTSSIAGVVVDADGGVIPGATISAKHDANGSIFNAVSDSNGAFLIPSVPVGKYTVTITLQGFKTAALKGVEATAGGPANVRAKLEVGGVSETVTVEGASTMIQTQSPQASTTIGTNSILNLPVGSRNTLDFVQFLPGVQTQGSVRDSTVIGLPQSSINITVDGVNVQDNHLKTGDGFFARMSPRLDAVEEVTLTTAAQGADAGGQGAIQIKFTTRSGTNRYETSAYHFYQSDKLNSNSYSNKVRGLPKGPLLLNQPGARFGGPVVIPGLYDGRGKAFFFVNYEHFYQPSTITTNSTLLLPDAQRGIFRYAGGPAGGVDVLALAASNGFTGTADPVIAQLLADIRASTTQAVGIITEITGNLNAERFTFQQKAKSDNKFPTYKLDYNLSNRHRVSFSSNRNYILATPDTTNSVQALWPNFPNTGEQHSVRYQITGLLRSTLGSNLVNELRLGASGGPTEFSPSLVREQFTGPLANQMGFLLGISGAGISNAGPSRSRQIREPTTRLFENTLTWLKGSHSVSTGVSYTRLGIFVINEDAVPAIGLGVIDTDPTIALFNNANNFPGSATADRTAARNLYAMLVGSVTSITATARIDGSTGQYVYNGRNFQQGRLQQFDTFIQDNWRIRPNLTINAGVRYALAPPFYPQNSSYSYATVNEIWGISGFAPGCRFADPVESGCNIFKAGTLNGSKPFYSPLSAGTQIFAIDKNNWAPSIGVNYTPDLARNAFMEKIFGGQSDTSFSAGWVRAYERRGMNDFTGTLDDNPGLNLSATRNQANGNLGAVPLLLRNGNLGGPPKCSESNNAPGCMLDAPVYPFFNTNTSGSITMFDPELQMPYSDTYTAAIQRQLGKRYAVEVRYIGSRNRDQWETLNYNEATIHENNFIDEFRNAQANLQASIAAGCGGTGQPACSFAFRGPGTGTVPLPIYLAFFSGVPLGQAGDASRYTSTLFTNSNFVSPLGVNTANIFTPAGTGTSGLAGDPVRQANSIAAGLPANYFRANPDMLGGARAVTNGGFTRYNSMQVQFRRRMSSGLQFDFNYTYGQGFTSDRFSFRVGRLLTRATDDVTHALKGTWVYEIPIGRGKRFGANMNAWIDGFAGGWIFSGTTRIQSGNLFDLGNVRVVGMTIEEAQQAFHLRKISNEIVYSFPQDIIDETIKALSTSSTSPTGYGALGPPTGRYFAPASTQGCFETIAADFGDCGVRSLILTGPPQLMQDWSFRKNVRFGAKTVVQISVDMFNVFNFVQWGGDTGQSTTLANWQSGLPGSRRTIQIGSRVTF